MVHSPLLYGPRISLPRTKFLSMILQNVARNRLRHDLTKSYARFSIHGGCSADLLEALMPGDVYSIYL